MQIYYQCFYQEHEHLFFLIMAKLVFTCYYLLYYYSLCTLLLTVY